MDGLEVRAYRTSDFPQVKEILELGNLYWALSDNAESFRKQAEERPGSILVATVDQRPVGTQIVVESFLPLMFRLAVHPDYRGKGIGKLLLSAGEAYLKAKGHNHVNILVAAEDADLQGFYRGQGYEPGHNYTWMFKEFDNAQPPELE